jgi:hypothetical protein
MDSSTFWALIGASRGRGRGDIERQASALTRLLERLAPEEIVEFDRTFREQMATAYRWDLWAAAFIINGGCSDDGFEYFRCWLIAQGEHVFHEALADPEMLVDGAEPEAEGEGMLYAAAEAYESRAGATLPETIVHPSEPAGEPWEEEDLEEMYPKLWARFA